MVQVVNSKHDELIQRLERYIPNLNHILDLLYSGVRQNDWETRPPPGNYSTASDTWIQVSTNKMHAGVATILIVTS